MMRVWCGQKKGNLIWRVRKVRENPEKLQLLCVNMFVPHKIKENPGKITKFRASHSYNEMMKASFPLRHREIFEAKEVTKWSKSIKRTETTPLVRIAWLSSAPVGRAQTVACDEAVLQFVAVEPRVGCRKDSHPPHSSRNHCTPNGFP